jgi:hypothetical protein
MNETYGVMSDEGLAQWKIVQAKLDALYSEMEKPATFKVYKSRIGRLSALRDQQMAIKAQYLA